MIDSIVGFSAPDSEMLAGWVAVLRELGTASSEPAVSDAERVEQIAALERLKSAASAAQARVTVAFDHSQRQAQRDAGTPERRVGAGVAAQVALARRDSPVKGARHLGLAHALVEELPHTLAALTSGVTSEWRATLITRETACLSREDRSAVDAELAARPGGIGALGDREAATEARRVAYRLDPHAVTDRAARAHSQRRVTLRPAPDTMAVLSGLLPAPQGVAVYAALTRHADTLRSGGDDRTRGQIMADTLVERVTGATTAGAVPVEVSLVMTDTSLLGADATPAQLEGYGPLPAPWARDWLRDTAADVWLRRLYTSPETGQLVAMDSRRRRFEGRLRRFVIVRDQLCRTPWCNAPIRHVDHPKPAAAGGPTSTTNAQGLCEACNYVKETPGWHTTTGPGGVVETTTPTGHGHRTRPPQAPGPTRPPGRTGPAHPTRPRPRPGDRAGPGRAEIAFRRDLHVVLAC